MADPVTVLGAVSGAASLAAQLVDGCIYCKKITVRIVHANVWKDSAAVEMPKQYKSLKVKIRWQQHRFLRFCSRANLLYSHDLEKYFVIEDPELLTDTLEEMDQLFSEFDKKNETYQKELTKAEDGATTTSKNIVDVLLDDDSIHPNDKQSPKIIKATGSRQDPSHVNEKSKSHGTEKGDYPRRWWSNLKHARKDFRDVMVHPRRWKWAAIDRAKFDKLVAQLESLNTRLESLLSDYERQQLKEDISQIGHGVDKSNEGILQIGHGVQNIHDDVKSLQTGQMTLLESSKAVMNALSSRETNFDSNGDSEGSKNHKMPKLLTILSYGRDPDFIGRKEILDTLLQVTKQPNYQSMQSRQALLGTGGVGYVLCTTSGRSNLISKSQIAIEYLYRLQEAQQQHIFWIYAGNATRFEQGYQEIAKDAGITTYNESEIVSDVYRWLSDKKNGSWTMVLDNVDDETFFLQQYSQSGRALRDFIPTAAHGSILITSRNKAACINLVGNSAIHSIEPMTTREAVDLLLTRLHPANEEEAEKLVEELDCLPLAITYASAYIKIRETMSLSKYLALFKDEQERNRLLEKTEYADDRRDWTSSNKAVIATWQISFDAVRTEDPEAADLLALMSMYDNHSIPRILLVSGDTFDLEFDEQIEKLLKYCLIKAKDENTYRLHRLIQVSMTQWLTKGNQLLRWQNESTVRLNQAFPDFEVKTSPVCQQLLPHVRKVISYESEEVTARILLLSNVGSYYQTNTSVKDSVTALRKASELSTKHLGTEHCLTREVSIKYAVMLQRAGDYAEAAKIFEQMIALVVSLESPSGDIFYLRCALGSCLISLGKQNEAKELTQLIMKDADSKRQPTTLGPWAIQLVLGYLIDIGGYKAAEKICRMEIDRSTNLYGLQSITTLQYMQYLIWILFRQGKDKKIAAVDLESEALAILTKLLGTKNKVTLQAKLNHGKNLIRAKGFDHGVGLLLTLREDLRSDAEARKMVNLATVLDTIANAYFENGYYDKAEQFYRESIETIHATFGPDHERKDERIPFLADVLEVQKKHDEAKQLRDKISPSKYLSKKRSKYLSDVALRMLKREELEEAEIMGRRALDECEKVFGRDAYCTRASALTIVHALTYLGTQKDFHSLWTKYHLDIKLVRDSSDETDEE